MGIRNILSKVIFLYSLYDHIKEGNENGLHNFSMHISKKILRLYFLFEYCQFHTYKVTKIILGEKGFLKFFKLYFSFVFYIQYYFIFVSGVQHTGSIVI